VSPPSPEPAAPKRPREGGPKPLAKAAAALAAIMLIAGSFSLARPGYSVDEEFTVFAVRGIQQHGLPLLPSGLLYDRGLAYSYAAWVVGAITGSELPAFRAISLIAAALSVFLTFVLVHRLANNPRAITASLLVPLSVPFWATATSGRFYAPFLAVYLFALICLTHRSWWLPLIAAAAVARLTHELAFTLAAVPFVCWLLDRNDRRRWVYAALSVVAGLLIGQVILLALHASVPSSGDTMVRRFFLWQVINLFERPGDRQFGIPLVVMVIGLIVAPKRAWTISVIALSVAVMILAFSIAQATNSAPLSVELVKAVLIDGSRYPLDMFWHIARTMPLTLLITAAGLLARSAGLGGEWRPGERAVHGLWLGWVLWFGVVESGITTNYLLLPIAFMLTALAIDSLALVSRLRVPPVAIFALVAFDQWGIAPIARMDAARPTIRVDGIDDIRAGLAPGDRVACTDELGCLMLVGRIDRWLGSMTTFASDSSSSSAAMARRAASIPACLPHFVPAICLAPTPMAACPIAS
jgi:hypothetical protein